MSALDTSIAITTEEVGACIGCFSGMAPNEACWCDVIIAHREQPLDFNEQNNTSYDDDEYHQILDDDGLDSYCEAMQDPASPENLASNKLTKEQREFQDYLDSL